MYLPGSDDTSRMIRRTLMRYLNLSLVMVLRSISIAVKRRFPTKEHLIEAGKKNGEIRERKREDLTTHFSFLPLRIYVIDVFLRIPSFVVLVSSHFVCS